MSKKKVVIVGGGVAGMSAAHELIRRGFAVEVYEARDQPGGKARSVNVPHSGKDGRKDLPGEHGFRFFPRFYRNLPATMKEIPFAGKPQGTFDNLIEASRELLARAGDKPNLLVPARFPRNFADLKLLVRDLFADTGLTPQEKEFAAARIWQLATSCDDRMASDYESLSWWDYTEAERFSDDYRALFAIGFTRTLVAARATKASTRVGGSILLQLLYGAITPGSSTDRLLDGPTSPRWIDPWLEDLRRHGVDYQLNSPVSAINTNAAGRIESVSVTQGGQTREVSGDYFLCAVPVEAMARLLDKNLLRLDPTLKTIRTLSRDVAWMNGIQFYLDREIDIDYGHAMLVDSPWALTLISQLQFWKDFDVADYGDGKVRGIISIDISNWDAKGIVKHGPKHEHKAAKDCTREQVKEDVWAQLKASLNKPGKAPLLRDEYLKNWYLDSDIEPVDWYGNSDHFTDEEPLLVNNINTWYLRPEAHTRIANLFLASDYVKTDVSLATMEGANEAARRAVNCIIAADGGQPNCKIYPLKRPCLLAPLRWMDQRRYARGLPWSSGFGLLSLLREALTP
jgi:uncharacterized protein with NAD-binding domain and iron-sulfur cluster